MNAETRAAEETADHTEPSFHPEDAPPPGASDAETGATAEERTAGDRGDQSGEERTRVLQMVADGKVTVDEAVELLKALEPDVQVEREVRHDVYGPPGGYAAPHAPDPFAPQRPFGPQGPIGPQGPVGPQWPIGPRGPFAGRGRKDRAGRQEDVLFHVAVPPPPAVSHPFVPPVPPTPPIPPTPPTPHVAPFQVHVGAHVLVFDVRSGDKRYSARLPLGLVGEVDRFLPRQIKQALEESEIDHGQLLDLVNNMDPSMVGQTLIDIRDSEDEDRRVSIHLE